MPLKGLDAMMLAPEECGPYAEYVLALEGLLSSGVVSE